jgi:Uma2 family endonuclease
MAAEAAIMIHGLLARRTNSYSMDMPTLRRHWTVDDLDDLPSDGNRYEVIDGELFVTPAPSYRHQTAVVEMVVRLREYLARERVAFVLVAPVDVEFSKETLVQPDLIVIPAVEGKRPETFTEAGRLLLAIEVVSPSSARADRVEKRELYRAEDVSEYWIVDLDSRTIERSVPSDRRVEVLDERIEWTCEGAAEPFVMDLTDYFVQILDR